MASSEWSRRRAAVCAVCLMLLPIHTLPLLAAERSETEVVKEKVVSAVKKVVGVATYYARRFRGKRTTSGARYNPEKMTAAHWSLPLGTRVRVKNLANDKEVTVVITDRCRKKAFPFIDLSRGAARRLGFLGKGRADVAITVLPDDQS